MKINGIEMSREVVMDIIMTTGGCPRCYTMTSLETMTDSNLEAALKELRPHWYR